MNFRAAPIVDCITDVFVSCSSYSCHTFTGFGGQTCIRRLGYQETFAIATCSSGSLTNFRTVTLPYTTSVTESPTSLTVSSFLLYQPLIELRYQSSDLASPSAQTGVEPDPVTSSTTGLPTTDQPDPGSNNGTGLSTGAKAGIGVGAGLGALLLIAGALLLLWRKKKTTPQAGCSGAHGGSVVYHDPQIYENRRDEMSRH